MNIIVGIALVISLAYHKLFLRKLASVVKHRGSPTLAGMVIK